MKKTLIIVTQGLILSSLLSACGRNYTPPIAVAAPPQMTLSQMNLLAMQGTQIEKSTPTKLTSTALSKTTSNTIKKSAPSEETPEKIDLKPVSEEIVKVQAKLRKATVKKGTSAADIGMSETEISAIRSWITKLEKVLLKEDSEFDAKSNSGFKIKSAEQGKDISIEMFLYHPTYNKRAKFWGINTAHDFLRAGRSPLRRWLLKKKLEGFFAPRGFSEQILFWVEQADLLRISGVSKDDAFMLVAHGITSVPDLARRNIIELTTMRLSMKLMALQHGFDAPSKSEMDAWVNEAKTMDVVIY